MQGIYTKPKLLIVDDAPIFLLDMELMLKHDYDVITTPHGDKAHTLYLINRPDIVCLDQNLGKGKPTGTDIAYLIRIEDDHTPILLITGNDINDIIIQNSLYEKKINDIITKPIDNDSFKNKLYELIPSKYSDLSMDIDRRKNR